VCESPGQRRHTTSDPRSRDLSRAGLGDAIKPVERIDAAGAASPSRRHRRRAREARRVGQGGREPLPGRVAIELAA